MLPPSPPALWAAPSLTLDYTAGAAAGRPRPRRRAGRTVSALPIQADRVDRATATQPCTRQDRRDVGRERALERLRRAQRLVRLLQHGQRGAVHQQRLCVSAGELDRARHQALDRVGHVVRLIEHVRGLQRHLAPGGVGQLVEHQEQPVRIDRARIQVIVAVFRVVEVEAAEPPGMDQARDDHLDVDVRCMVTEVDQAEGLGPERLRRHERGAPVLDDGGVERRLVHLVLDEQPPVGGEPRVDAGRGFEVALEGTREVLLAGEVGAIADPQRQRLRAELATDADAVEVMLDRLRAHRGRGVRQAPELVGLALAALVLESVGVHGIEAEPEARGVRLERAVVLAGIPGQVQRDGRRRAGEPVDHSAVLEFLEDVARLARPGEAREARPASANTPGGQCHGEIRHTARHGLDVETTAHELRPECLVVGIERGGQRCVSGSDEIGVAWIAARVLRHAFPLPIRRA